MKEIKGRKVQLHVNRSRYTQYLTSLDKGSSLRAGLSCYVVQVSALCAAKLHATLGIKKNKSQVYAQWEPDGVFIRYDF